MKKESFATLVESNNFTGVPADEDLMLAGLWGKERQALTRQVQHRKSLRFVSGEWWASLCGECDAACGGEHR